MEKLDVIKRTITNNGGAADGEMISADLVRDGHKVKSRFREEIKPFIDSGEIIRVREGSKMIFKIGKNKLKRGVAPSTSPSPIPRVDTNDEKLPVLTTTKILTYIDRAGGNVTLDRIVRKAFDETLQIAHLNTIVKVKDAGLITGHVTYDVTKEGFKWLAENARVVHRSR